MVRFGLSACSPMAADKNNQDIFASAAQVYDLIFGQCNTKSLEYPFDSNSRLKPLDLKECSRTELSDTALNVHV